MTSSRRDKRKIALFAVLSATGIIAALVLTAWSDERIPFPRPDSHRGAWVENHGIEAQVQMNEAGQTGRTCLTCHEKNDCIACHTSRLPRDHTNYWRTSGHGLTASVNRERCLICHRQDYCVRCHNETAPRSHVGNWGRPGNRHCTWCHFSSGMVPADSCGVCHKIAPHTSRPTIHPVIGPQTDCRACHT